MSQGVPYEVVENESAVLMRDNRATTANPVAPPQLHVLTFNGPQMRHRKFLWVFVPLVLLLLAII